MKIQEINLHITFTQELHEKGGTRKETKILRGDVEGMVNNGGGLRR